VDAKSELTRSPRRTSGRTLRLRFYGHAQRIAGVLVCTLSEASFILTDNCLAPDRGRTLFSEDGDPSSSIRFKQDRISAVLFVGYTRRKA
jgi:hypothetical protein